MKAVLAELASGQPATAVFRSELYGSFAISGTAIRSVATGALLLGGHPLDTSSTARVSPVPDLLELSIGPNDVAVPSSGLAAALSDLRHGQPAVGYFEQAPYGKFTVTGFAVEAPIGRMFLLGGLQLSTKGVPGPLLVALEHFHQTTTPSPAPITYWPNTDDND